MKSLQDIDEIVRKFGQNREEIWAKSRGDFSETLNVER